MFEWRTFYFYWSHFLFRDIYFYSSITFEYYYHPCVSQREFICLFLATGIEIFINFFVGAQKVKGF